jgi:hypothetical protein
MAWPAKLGASCLGDLSPFARRLGKFGDGFALGSDHFLLSGDHSSELEDDLGEVRGSPAHHLTPMSARNISVEVVTNWRDGSVTPWRL